MDQEPCEHCEPCKGDGTDRPPLPSSPMFRTGRRAILTGTAGAVGAGLVNPPGCRCGGCANAMAPLVNVNPDLEATYDKKRDARRDEEFAMGMNAGMIGYERFVADRKKQLFEQLFLLLPKGGDATIVEVGMGTFPNAPFYGDASSMRTPTSTGGAWALDIIGIDPNDSMEAFANANLRKASGGWNAAPAASMRIAHGVAEALPLASNSADAVVCTLTLCSVKDPVAAVAEIKRILKPGAPLLFIEHVLSEDPVLALQQKILNDMQVMLADGCHLNRKTLETIEGAGFAKTEMVEKFNVPGTGLISSQVSGIAIA